MDVISSYLDAYMRHQGQMSQMCVGTRQLLTSTIELPFHIVFTINISRYRVHIILNTFIYNYVVYSLTMYIILCVHISSGVVFAFYMMTSSNGNIFRVTGHLCGEFTGPGEFPAQWPVTQSFDVFFDLRLNKRLSKQSWGWWFETLSWSLWHQCNELVSPTAVDA